MVTGSDRARGGESQPPVRRRYQALIERRCNRRKYDGDRVLAAFNEVTRDEVNLDVLSERMLALVDSTMQPARVALWLGQPVGRGESESDARYS